MKLYLMLILSFLFMFNFSGNGFSQSDNNIPVKSEGFIRLMNSPDKEVLPAQNSPVPVIENSVSHHLSWLDWLIIIFYGIGMVSVGYYYMRRTKSSEDYMLGGRRLKSRTVGLSLFATLLSTISYIAYPGEMIMNGPVFMGQIIGFPIVYYIVGYLFIPLIMRLKITSAYEILEMRFGNSIRTLGAFIFLLLRVLWMSVIIYVTTDKILIPLTGWDQSVAPWICVVMGIVTLMYTSMGGLRAVVVTDAVQTFILFGGAVLSLLLITIHLGGISEWWPSEWVEHWEAPRLGFQTSGNRTFGWFMLSMAIWFICTNGSDQMAIQRFLATRNVKTARRVLGTMLISNVVVLSWLGLLGLALMAYFRANPQLLKEGQSIVNNADQLFSQYIITSLPAGISGLVIAGLIAAAMSSLSSGVNSSSSVIMTDFVVRFRQRKLTEACQIKTAKLISVLIGIVAVGLSLFVYAVPGNVLEVTYRVVNLFTAPLFIMFCMALFVPWATSAGTWIATICSSIVAILIAFWQNIFGTEGISFLYIMPASLVVGVVVGMTFSLIPMGSKATPMLKADNQDIYDS